MAGVSGTTRKPIGEAKTHAMRLYKAVSKSWAIP